MPKQEQVVDLNTLLKNYLNIQEAADLVGKTRQTIYNLINIKAIECQEVKSIKLVKKSDLIRVALARGWIRRKGE